MKQQKWCYVAVQMAATFRSVTMSLVPEFDGYSLIYEIDAVNVVSS